jgi:pimeloyl-ACP methyl ester carboxylesterase
MVRAVSHLTGLFLALCAIAACAAPCTTATPGCAEWIAMSDARAMVYRSHSLEAKNEAITRAVVVVHGGTRDAHNNFRHLLAAAFLADALDTTVIVSPRFASNYGKNCHDSLAAGELNWICEWGGGHWNAGGLAQNAKVASYDVVDEILRRLARKELFPNLKSIVVAGHSSGGQFVSRYQMANRMHDKLGNVRLTYFVSNPGAYTYLDALRPTASAIPPNVSSSVPGYIPTAAAAPPAPFVPYADERNCTAYDQWPYGLKNRVAYTAAFPDDQLKKQAIERPMTLVLGELDILPLVNFDISCNAMAQGSSRLARGMAYGKYIRENHGAKHATVVVPGCGHSTRCMFTADQALPLLFP